jgi:diacylglycerol kinase (ATP)
MDNPYKGKKGFERLWNALFYTLAGVQAAAQHEDAFRQELWLAAALIPAAVLLPVSLIAKALLIGSILFVLIVELLNSAVEATVDRISLELHPLAKRAKDYGSAAVFLSLANLALVWLLVLLTLLP